jgi:hypothetical protein
MFNHSLMPAQARPVLPTATYRRHLHFSSLCNESVSFPINEFSLGKGVSEGLGEGIGHMLGGPW